MDDPTNNNYEQFIFTEIANTNSELLSFFGRDKVGRRKMIRD